MLEETVLIMEQQEPNLGEEAVVQKAATAEPVLPDKFE